MLHPDFRFIGWSSALWRSPQICRSPKGKNMMVGMPDILNASILIVDDQESNVSLLEQLLRATGYTRVASTMNPQEVCALHRRNGYDLILLDLQMPGMDGFQVMAALKTNESDSYLPVIVLTAQAAHRLRALQAGAKDFISKPFDLLEVKTRIHNMLEVRLLYKKLENFNQVLEQRSLHDSMTGLPNRDLFDDRLTHAIALAKRHAWTLAVMFLDLDRFKCINDTHGHAVGDGVLKEVAKRLLEHARDEDTVCRNGGDEFLYLLMNPQGSENIERIAGVLLKNIAQPIDMDDLQPVIKASIGIAIFPDNGATVEQLIGNADTAMYRAKKRMTGCVFFNALETDGTTARAPGLRP
jgi:two-component system cell cycle response regulator